MICGRDKGFSTITVLLLVLNLLGVGFGWLSADGKFPADKLGKSEYTRQPVTESDYRADAEDYTSHAPITITSDASFAAKAASEGWVGDGSEDDPYIINGLHINSTEICVYITSTVVHFEIKDCLFSSPSGTGAPAVDLWSVTNGRINSCIVDASRSGTGFFLSGSSNMILTNNTVMGNAKGFSIIGSSDNNTLVGNSVVSNSGTGFIVRDSNNTALVDNTAVGNALSGFSITACFNSTLKSNTATDNFLHGFILRESSQNMMNDNTASCSGFGSGIVIYRSSNQNTVTNNSITSNSENGIFIYSSSSHNTVVGNIISANSKEGILLYPSCSMNRLFLNVIYDNTFPHARDEGADNMWDDGVSTGNYWADYSGTGSYSISGSAASVDRYPRQFVHPTLDSPEDLTYEEGTIGHEITWNATASFPLYYMVYRNGTLIESNEWNGSQIVVSVDGLPVGIYEYALTVEDALGGTVSDTVFVTVFTESNGAFPEEMGILMIAGVVGFVVALALLSYVLHSRK